MQKLMILLISIFMLGCAQTNTNTNTYNAYYSKQQIADLSQVKTLAYGSEPKVFESNNFARDAYNLAENDYIAIGHSSYYDQYDSFDNEIRQGKKVHALVVLVAYKHEQMHKVTENYLVKPEQTGDLISNETDIRQYSRQQIMIKKTAFYYIKAKQS